MGDRGFLQRLMPASGARWLVGAALFGLGLPGLLWAQTYLIRPYRVTASSMAPTLLPGDHVVVNRLAYGLWMPDTGLELPGVEWLRVPERVALWPWDMPQRGEVVAHRVPGRRALTYLKRVMRTHSTRGDSHSPSTRSETLWSLATRACSLAS